MIFLRNSLSINELQRRGGALVASPSVSMSYGGSGGIRTRNLTIMSRVL